MQATGDDAPAVWQYVDFDFAMKPEKAQRAFLNTQRVFAVGGPRVYSFFKRLYQLNNLASLRKRGLILEQKIPKIIHQIWIGGTLPEVFIPFCTSWKHYHTGRGWSYKLWTDEDLPQLKLYNQRFFDENTSPGVRSDLMKWEIIERFGGVYVDVDYECLQPIDDLLCYDFVTAIQPLDSGCVQLGAAFFAAHPEHPILKHCIETIKDDWHLKIAPAKTGPIHMTKSFLKVAGRNNKLDIALPASYFYPLGVTEKEMHYEDWIAKGAYAVHHWAKSWLPPHYRLEQFKELQNEDSLAGWNS